MGNKGEAVALLDAFSEKFGTHLMTGQAQKARAAIDAGETPPPLKLGQDFWTAGAAPQPLKETPAGPATGPVEGPVAVPVGDYSSMNVAAILPLSENKWSDVGQLVLKGMKIAFKNHRPATKGFKSDLVVLDTKGNSDTAAKMVDDLSGRSDILAVVGPLLSAEAGKAAPKAQEKKIPMITVTQREGITQSGSNVFRLFLTPKAQAEAMARYAIGALGYGRLASLYPDDAYGRGMHGYFEKEVQRLGGRVVSSVAYKPDAKEFSEPIQKLAGVGKAARKVSAGRKVQVGFEAVFLPDGPSAVTMIAPQFPYHDIIKMKFLGSSLWHKPQLLSNTARYVQNCVVPTAFFPGVDRPEVKEFVELYRKEVNDPAAVPGQFEAYGYDAGRLLLYLMDQKHVSTRDQMIQELHKLGPFPGVTGRFQFDASGEYQVEPILITVEGEEFKPVGEK
jgi:ABC-type branched-subunit amino acid transport system substrate-binding protein